MTRVAFLGTTEAAGVVLRRLADDNEVAVAITRPDKPRGRSSTPQPSPVKVTASQLGIPVSEPSRAAAVAEDLARSGPLDVGVVVAYGVLLRPDALTVPGHGMLNAHFSLLPRWRGAAPVPRAILAGDPMTGVSIIKLDEGVDTGPVLTAQAVDIGEDETAGDLTARLAVMAGALLAASIGPYVAGGLRPVPQVEEGATYAAKIEKEERRLSPSDSPEQWTRRVRALAPRPAAVAIIDGEQVKILEARPATASVPLGRWENVGGWPVVGVAGGSVVIRGMQSPGRRPLSGNDWARGRQDGAGEVS